jgi:ABC-type transporter Mla subunit MlaD
MCLRAGGLLERAGGTLDEIDRQINTLSTPVATTLTHVGGIADTADTTLARLATVVGQLENVASGASKTANLIGSTLSGVSSAMKQKPRDGRDESAL